MTPRRQGLPEVGSGGQPLPELQEIDPPYGLDSAATVGSRRLHRRVDLHYAQVMAPGPQYEFGVDYVFEDLFPDAVVFAGVKALFGPMAHRYLCFGAGSSSAAASKASKAPWAIGIGTLDAWEAKNRGRVLNLVRLTTSQQKTSQLAVTAEEKSRYGRWPESVAVTDVFEFVEPPRVIEDLGMTKHPLIQAHDKVSELNAERLPIVAALQGYRIRLVDLPPLPAGLTIGKVVPSAVSAEDGGAIMRLVTTYERNSKLSKFMKAANKEANGGLCRCEGCGFQDENIGLLDAHHKIPVHFEAQTTTPELMAILCPTCHRVVHRLAEAPHLPMGILALREWHAARVSSAI